MYLPKLFKSEDSELLEKIINDNSFSNLIVYGGRVFSTKAMFMFCKSETGFFLETHLNRANPVAKHIRNAHEVLCDFTGVHTYISSSWYDHKNVSTWNYEAVQIYGTVEIMTDEELYTHVSHLTDTYEATQQCPMTAQKMGRDFIEKEMRGALGMKIIPTEVNIKQKLSQNRNKTNFQNIITHLEQSEFPADKVMADKMKAIINTIK